MAITAATLMLLLLQTVAQAQSEATDPYAAWHPGTAGGLHFFGPVRASLAVGGGFRREESTVTDRSRLVFAFLEPGIGGLRVSAGYAESVGSAAAGWSVRASLLKLIREPARRRLTGIEFQVIGFYCAGARLGAFRPLGRGETRRTVWLADFSICL